MSGQPLASCVTTLRTVIVGGAEAGGGVVGRRGRETGRCLGYDPDFGGKLGLAHGACQLRYLGRRDIRNASRADWRRDNHIADP